MNARELMRRLREEQRSTCTQVAPGATRPDDSTLGAIIADPAPISLVDSDRALWDEEALLVRRWEVNYNLS
jgi:hypothetical protein